MTYYTLSYDLRRERGPDDYRRLHRALRSLFDWCTPLESFWIIRTGLSPSTIIKALLEIGALDDDDGIVILETTLRGSYRRAGGIDSVQWLNARLKAA